MSVLQSKGIHHDQVHFIYPGDKTEDTWFTNSLRFLPVGTKELKINEVIFSSEDLKMKEIIKAMTQMESQVSFRIGGDDSLHIIGSHSKNEQGEFLSLTENYTLSSDVAIRYKRIMDICLCLVLTPFLPILWLWSGFKTKVFVNLFAVFIGKATWVGYGGDRQDYSFLPQLPKAVIKYPWIGKHFSYS